MGATLEVARPQQVLYEPTVSDSQHAYLQARTFLFLTGTQGYLDFLNRVSRSPEIHKKHRTWAARRDLYCFAYAGARLQGLPWEDTDVLMDDLAKETDHEEPAFFQVSKEDFANTVWNAYHRIEHPDSVRAQYEEKLTSGQGNPYSILFGLASLAAKEAHIPFVRAQTFLGRLAQNVGALASAEQSVANG